MKILLIHCENLEFRNVRKSSRPAEVRSEITDGKISQRFKDTLAVFVCMERWDKEEDLSAAKEIVLRHSEMISVKRITVVPFAHLSSFLMDPKQANKMTQELFESLKKSGLDIGKSSFGYHKELELMIKAYGHPGSVAFRSIPENSALDPKSMQNVQT